MKMARRKPRIINKATKEAAKAAVPFCPLLPNLDIQVEDVAAQMPITLPPEKETDTDRLFRLIYEESRKGYCFTEPETGIPWIHRSDIEDKGDGIFVIRFRCPPHYIHKIHSGALVNAVCQAMNSSRNLFHETKYENGIPFEECVWVLQKDGMDIEPEFEDENIDNFDSLEEFPDNFTDDSSIEEIEARCAAALDNFL